MKTLVVAVSALLTLSLPGPAATQTSPEALDKLFAPIALYPDALLGPIIYRRLLSGGVIDADFLDRLIALVLPGR